MIWLCPPAKIFHWLWSLLPCSLPAQVQLLSVGRHLESLLSLSLLVEWTAVVMSPPSSAAPTHHHQCAASTVTLVSSVKVQLGKQTLSIIFNQSKCLTQSQNPAYAPINYFLLVIHSLTQIQWDYSCSALSRKGYSLEIANGHSQNLVIVCQSWHCLNIVCSLKITWHNCAILRRSCHFDFGQTTFSLELTEFIGPASEGGHTLLRCLQHNWLDHLKLCSYTTVKCKGLFYRINGCTEGENY